jgi:phenylalanyl-tRNA synthetase beta chain
MGARRPAHFTDPEPPPIDEWDAKAAGELVARAAFPGAAVELAPASGDALWTVQVDGEPRGVVRRLALDAPVWAAPAFGIEVELASLSAAPEEPGRRGEVHPGAVPSATARRARALPTAPAAERDVSLLVPDGVGAGAVEAVLRREGGDLLERAELTAEFQGGGVPPGARSLTWRLAFRHAERTLRDKEIEGRMQKLLRAVEGELGVRQRL